MNDIVVDSSVVAKWILPESDSPKAHQLVSEIALQGGRLIVLDLALAEVANAIWKRYHQRLATADESRQFLVSLFRAPVHVEPFNPLLSQALEIAMKYDRAIYDALFVALAEELRLSGVTADEPLVRALHGDYPSIVLLRDWATSAE
jgi:predicted nucleic acid-binding protein